MTPTAARRRRHGRLPALAAVVVVVVTTATLALAGCSPRVAEGQGGEAKVRAIAADYLQALEDGDAETALALTDVAAHDLTVTLTPDSAGWLYRLTAYRSVQGTLLPDACVGLGRETCAPGGPASDYISFGSWGRVALDDDGAVVLTRVGRF